MTRAEQIIRRNYAMHESSKSRIHAATVPTFASKSRYSPLKLSGLCSEIVVSNAPNDIKPITYADASEILLLVKVYVN